MQKPRLLLTMAKVDRDTELPAYSRINGLRGDDNECDTDSNDGLMNPLELEVGGRCNPEETALCSLRNIAIPIFYFLLGFLLKFPYVAVRQYLRLDLEESPAIQTLVFVGTILS